MTVSSLSPKAVWAGRVLSGLVIAFTVLDATMKLIPVAPVMDAQQQLGFDDSIGLTRGLGALLLACTVLYAIPRTALLGAVLLTGFLGGAIAIHLRIGSPLLTHVLFGFYIGVLLWVGLFLRNRTARLLLPWSSYGEAGGQS